MLPASLAEQLTEEAVHTGNLDLSSRSLQVVPRCVFSCAGLTSLNLSCNSLEQVPSDLCDLITLYELDLSFNKVTELPSSLGQLQRLVSLKASYNQLTALPAEVVGLTSLEVLHLNDNRIAHLPTRFLGSLVSLTHLQLQYNALKYLPIQLGELPSLQLLQLEGNPLQHVPLRQLAEAGGATGEGVDLVRLRQQLPLQPQPQASPSGSRPSSTVGAVRALASRGSTGAVTAPDMVPQGLSPQAETAAQGQGSVQGQGQGQGASSASSHAAASASAPEGQGQVQHSEGTKLSSGGASARPKPAIDILVIDETGPITAPGPGTPHDAEADADASDVWAKLGPQTEEGTSDPVPLSASELATLQDVDELPPAAAAVLYRTWDAVRTGSREMSEGRPLTRGGTASLHGQAATAAARKLLASSGGLPPKSASRPRTGAPGTASGTRRPLTSGSLVKDVSNMPFPGSATSQGSKPAAADASSSAGAFDALPPITFPLTSGVRSMLRRMGSASSTESKGPAGPLASTGQAADSNARQASAGSSRGQSPGQGAGPSLSSGTLRASASWGASSSRVTATETAAEATEADLSDSLDLVRQLLGARNPDLLHTLDSALDENEPDEDQPD